MVFVIPTCLLCTIAQMLYRASKTDNASVGRVLGAMAAHVPELWSRGVARATHLIKLSDLPALARRMAASSEAEDWTEYMTAFDLVARFGHSKGVGAFPTTPPPGEALGAVGGIYDQADAREEAEGYSTEEEED